MQLVSESVKTKQAHSFFLSEKQTLARQLQQVNSSIESVKMRIAQSEEQVKLLSSLLRKLVSQILPSKCIYLFVFIFLYQPIV